MSEWFQIAVIVFIVLTIGWHAWRTAQANPQSTGTLGNDLSGLDTKVNGFGARLADLENDVKRLDDNAASKGDIKRVERALASLQGEVAEIGKSAAAREATLDHVKGAVDRMLDIIMKRGM